MIQILLPNNTKLKTDLSVQNGTLNRQFSLSGVAKDLTKAPMWRKVNGLNREFYCWIFSYRYIDDRSKGFDIKINHYDAFDGKVDVR